MHSDKNRYLGLAVVSFTAFVFFFCESAFSSITVPIPVKWYQVKCTQQNQWGRTDEYFINCPEIQVINNQCNCPPGWTPQSSRLLPGKIGRRASHTSSLHPSTKRDSRRQVSPNAEAEPTYDFTHTLKGEWEDVVGYIGFQYRDYSDNKDYIACLIGLPVESLGNDQYKSEGWDKKIFWLDAGDGAPMHVCAIYAPNYVEDGVEYDNVFWAPNFEYLAPGVQDQSQARYCELWMYLDEEDEVEEVWVDVYDANYELLDSKELGIGDQLKAFTPIIDPSEPGAFYSISPDNRFQTIKKEPLFLYEHMTPNVDFVFETYKGFDFDNIDLLYILYAENWDEEDVCEFTYSTPKDVGLKWGNKPAKVENWFLLGVSGIMNFFTPSK